MNLNFGEIYSTSWDVFKKDWIFYCLYMVIMIVVSALVISIVPILNAFVGFLLLLPIISVALKATKGESVAFGDFFDLNRIFTKRALIVALIYGVISLIPIVSVLILIVLSVICFPIYSVVIDKDLSIKENFTCSMALTKNVRIDIIIFLIISVIISIIGIICLFIGIIPAMAIIAISQVVVYRKLLEINEGAPIDTEVIEESASEKSADSSDFIK